jgi:hypothetical protein
VAAEVVITQLDYLLMEQPIQAVVVEVIVMQLVMVAQAAPAS